MTDFTATRIHIYVSGAVIYAANHNANENEIYNQFNASMHATTGHTHSGSTGDGTKIGSTGLNLTDDYDWSGAHSFGSTVDISGATTVGSTLDVTGDSTIGGTLDVADDITVSGDLGVDVNATVGGTLGVTGVASFGDDIELDGTKSIIFDADGDSDTKLYESTEDTVKLEVGSSDHYLRVTKSSDETIVESKSNATNGSARLQMTTDTNYAYWWLDGSGTDVLKLGLDGTSNMWIVNTDGGLLLPDVNPPAPNRLYRRSGNKGFAAVTAAGSVIEEHNIDSISHTASSGIYELTLSTAMDSASNYGVLTGLGEPRGNNFVVNYEIFDAETIGIETENNNVYTDGNFTMCVVGLHG